MQFSVIYSVDVPRDTSIAPYRPPHLSRLWDRTEGDENYEYGYLEGVWAKGKHRKWCAVLTREQFDEFVSHVGLQAEDVQTMGSLGAPGCGFGLSPAVSFRSDDPDAILSAYVYTTARSRGRQAQGARLRGTWRRDLGARPTGSYRGLRLGHHVRGAERGYPNPLPELPAMELLCILALLAWAAIMARAVLTLDSLNP